MDHGPAADVAITADRLVMVEGAVGKGGLTADLIANRAPLRNADLDNVGTRGGGVISAQGLIVTEGAAGHIKGAGKQIDDGPTKALVHAGDGMARTTVAAAAAYGQVVVECAAGDGNGGFGSN